jgi:SAM-dependent methyltransferase
MHNYEYLEEKLSVLDPCSVILDLGAGARYFRNLYRDHRYIGLDFRPYDGVSIVADLTKRLPLAPDGVDVVVLSNTLEHMREPELLLEECHRVLRPGGAIMIVEPFMIRVHQVPYDFMRYTRYMLDYLLSNARYRDIEIREIGDIFDVHEVVLRDLFIVLKKNAQAKMENGDARDVRKRVLSPFRRNVESEIKALRSLCGDDVSVLGEKQYPHGYGVVAYK